MFMFDVMFEAGRKGFLGEYCVGKHEYAATRMSLTVYGKSVLCGKYLAVI